MEEEVVKDMTPRLIKDLGTRYPTEKSNYKKKYGLVTQKLRLHE